MWFILAALFFSGLTHADSQTWIWALREARTTDMTGVRAEAIARFAQAELAAHPQDPDSAQLRDAYLEYKRGAYARDAILGLSGDNTLREPLLSGLRREESPRPLASGQEHPFFVINQVRTRSLTNFWPGIDDIARYQPDASAREREIWQQRKDITSRATLIALNQTLENVLVLQSSVFGIRGEPLRKWANEWMKTTCPLCFHRDRELLWQWSEAAARAPAVSAPAWAKRVCQTLDRNGYPRESRPMPRQIGNHLWGPSYSLSDQKAEQDWIRSRVRAIYLSSITAPLGSLLMTPAISRFSQGVEPLSVQLDCENPETTSPAVLRQAAREAMDEATRLWTDFHRDNDPWNLSQASITHAMKDLLVRNPAAVSRAMLTTASQTPWIVAIASKIHRDQVVRDNIETAVFFGATLASMLIPAAGELLAATVIEQAIIRAGLVGISCLKMAREWHLSREALENSKLFKRAFFASSDHYALVGSSLELQRSRELVLDLVIDLGFTVYQAFKLYKNLAKAIASPSGRVPAAALNERMRMESAKIAKASKRFVSSSSRQVLKKTIENSARPERAY